MTELPVLHFDFGVNWCLAKVLLQVIAEKIRSIRLVGLRGLEVTLLEELLNVD